MRIIFMGTPNYAVPFLSRLLKENEDVVAVVTRQDSPVGRQREILAPPVKVFALEQNLKVLQPAKVNEPLFIETVRGLSPEVMVVVGFGQILGQPLLDIPPVGCINVHFSLLPKYRGASPIQAAIINGDDKTGVSTIYMEKKLDSGPVIMQREVPVDYKDTAFTLMEKLTATGVEVLIETLIAVKNGKVAAQLQDETQASYVSLLTRDSGLISWEKSSRQLYNFVRGMYPWPGAFTYYISREQKKHVFKIWEARELPSGENILDQVKPGTIIDIVKNKGLAVSCKDGVVLLTKVQPEDGKVMSAYDFVLGHSVKKGDVLG